MRKKKILSILMSVIMILAMVPSVAFAASGPYDIWAYSTEAESADDYTVLEGLIADGKTEPDKADVLAALQAAGLVAATVEEDALTISFYNGDSGNIAKMLQGNGKAYGFNKATLRLDHVAMQYEVEVTEPTVETVTATFDLNGGKTTWGADTLESVTVEAGEKVTVPTANNFVKDGFTFAGWKIDEEDELYKGGSYTITKDTNFTIEWTEITSTEATATFDLDGGSVTDTATGVKYNEWIPTTVEKNEKVWIPTADQMSKDGFTFVEWQNADGDVVEGGWYVLTADETFTAIWAEKTYTVSFKAYDKATREAMDVVYDDEAVVEGKTPKTEAIEVAGYEFFGWFEYDDTIMTSPVYNKVDIADIAIYADTTYYAVYTKAPVKAIFDLNGGKTTWGADALDTVKVEAGEKITVPTANNFTKDGFKFAGWQVNDEEELYAGGSYTLTEDTTFTIVWEEIVPEYVTITFDANGGTDVEAVEIVKASEIGTLPETEKDGLTFAGWFTEDGTEVTAETVFDESATVTAKWNATATYDFAGGTLTATGATKWSDKTVEEGKTVYLPVADAIVKDGFTFDGWKVNDEEELFAGGNYKMTTDTAFVAQWSEIPPEYVTVTFDANGGTDVEAVEIVKATAIGTLPETEKEGLAFAGWFTEDGTEITADTVFDESATVTAKWNAVATFDLNGGKTTWGTAELDSSVVEEGESVLVPRANNFVKDGFKFAGWKIDGEEELFAGGDYTLTKDTTFTIEWEEIVPEYVTITFDANGGTAVDAVEIIKGSAIGTLPETENGKYTFAGWFTEDGTEVTAETKFDESATVTAKWYVTATFDFNGGKYNNLEGWAPIEATSGAQIVLPLADNMNLEGWTFAGWNVYDADNTLLDVVTADADRSYTLVADVNFVAVWTRDITLWLSKDNNAQYISQACTITKGETELPLIIDVFSAEQLEEMDYDAETDTLKAWFDDTTWQANKADFETLFTKDVVADFEDATQVNYVAAFITKGEIEQYTVTFDYNNGADATETVVYDGETVEAPAEPVKTNRVFDGWYVEGADEAYDFTTPVTADITLVAKYNLKLEYNIYKDGFTKDTNLLKQETIVVPEDTDIAAYLAEAFDETVTATEYDNVYKWYSRNVWVANYNADDATRIAAFADGAETADFSDVDSITYNATRGFMVFALVDTDANAVTVTFDNTAYCDDVAALKLVKGSALGDVAVENVADGYQLEGWYDGTTKVAADTTIDKDVTLKAKWNVEVTFNTYSNGDYTAPEVTTEWVTVKISTGEGNFTTEAPTYGWYTKADWDTVAAGEDATFADITAVGTKVTAPVTYYGMNIDQVKATFSAGTGVKATGIPAEKVYDYNSTLDAATIAAVPVREKYQFVCWTVDGEDVTDLSTYKLTKDTEFVAKWEARDIVVNFEIVNEDAISSEAIAYYVNTDVESQTIKYGEKAAEPTGIILLDDYAVDGWYTDEACTDKIDFAEYTFTADSTTLYAKMTAKVTFNIYGSKTSAKPYELSEYVVIGNTISDAEYFEITDEDIAEYLTGGHFYGWFTEEAWLNIQKGTDYTIDDKSLVMSGATVVADPMDVFGKATLGYTVKFVAGDGVKAENMPADQTVEYGKKATEPTEIPTRTGYTFDGWVFDFNTKITDDVTIEAKWSLNNYKIIYDPNGGEILNPLDAERTISYGSTYGSLLDETQVSKDGAKFLGWTTVKDDASTKVTAQDVYKVESDTTLYALWDMTTVRVNYVVKGGKVVDADGNAVVDRNGREITSENIEYGTKVGDIRKATKDGLNFVGWYTDAALTTPYENTELTATITLYAKFEAVITLEVYENDNYTSTIAGGEITVDENNGIDLPSVDELGVVLGDTDEVLAWYTVDEFAKVKAGQTATAVADMTATGELTLCAKVIRHYTVTFETNEGTKVEAQDVAYKALAVEPTAPTKEGNEFAGWYTTADLTVPFDFETPITADTTVYAKWDRTVLTVTLNMSEEFSGIADGAIQVYYGETVADAVAAGETLPDTTFAGYTFDGWYLDGVYYDINTTPVKEAITLDAAWHINKFEAVIEGTYTYTGSEIEPTIVITDATTKEAVDTSANPIDVTYEAVSDNAEVGKNGLPVNAGTYKVTVAQKYAYPAYESYKYVKADPVELTLVVAQADISDTDRFTVNIDDEAYDPENLVSINYTGSEILLDGSSEEGYEVIINDVSKDDRLYSEDPAEYTVEYANNVNAGTATATVTGVGNYTGTVEVKFEIAKLQIDIGPYLVTIDPESFEYNGEAQQPSVTVKKDANSPALVYGQDYNVGYMLDGEPVVEPVDVGTYTVVIEGLGNYTGQIASQPSFSIVEKSLKDATITVELAEDEYEWTGSEITPAVTVKDGSEVLVEGKDYTVAYANNVELGEAIVTVTGIGNYTDSVEKAFTITAAAIDDYTVTITGSPVVYNGEVQEPTVEVKKSASSEALVEGEDYTVSYELNGEAAETVDAGVYTVVVTGIGHYKGTATGSFEITAKSLDSDGVTVELTKDEFDWTGEEIEAPVVITDGDKTLTEGVDYTVEYTDNVEPGTATVTITGIGNYEGTVTKTFTIYSRYYYVTGTVRYASGRPIKYAKVTLKGTDYLGNEVSLSTKTDSKGTYKFKNLRMGDYVVSYRTESKTALLNEQE